MTAAINDFVEEWSKYFKTDKWKNIKLEAIKKITAYRSELTIS